MTEFQYSRCLAYCLELMKAKLLFLWASVIMVLVTGCGGSSDNSSNNSNANAAQNNTPSDGSNGSTPSSLAGKAYSFTVTARQGLSEPVGATYTISFDNANYTFTPSPQNAESTTPFTASYTYDPSTATAILSGVEAVTATFNFTTPTSGTYHFMEEDGEMQDGTFSQL